MNVIQDTPLTIKIYITRKQQIWSKAQIIWFGSKDPCFLRGMENDMTPGNDRKCVCQL